MGILLLVVPRVGVYPCVVFFSMEGIIVSVVESIIVSSLEVLLFSIVGFCCLILWSTCCCCLSCGQHPSLWSIPWQTVLQSI
jgi:hypothetical protein